MSATVTITDTATGTIEFESPADSIAHARRIMHREISNWRGMNGRQITRFAAVKDTAGSDPTGGFHAFSVHQVIDGENAAAVADAYINANN